MYFLYVFTFCSEIIIINKQKQIIDEKYKLLSQKIQDPKFKSVSQYLQYFNQEYSQIQYQRLNLLNQYSIKYNSSALQQCRYSDVLPIPYTQLKQFENANLVSIENAPIDIFQWHQSIYNSNISTIIQLTQFYEERQGLGKALRYIPLFDNEPKDFSENALQYIQWYEQQQNYYGTNKQQTTNQKATYAKQKYIINNITITSKLILNNDQFVHVQLIYSGPRKKQVNYFYYKNWSDMSQPQNEQHIFDFIEYVSQYNVENTSPLIHCSAGVGRSSTFAICWILQKFKQQNKNSVFELMEQFRIQRNPICIQTQQQLQFLFSFEQYLNRVVYE